MQQPGMGLLGSWEGRGGRAQLVAVVQGQLQILRLSHARQLTPQPSCLLNSYSWCAGGGGNSLAQFEKKKKAASQRAGRHDKVSIEGRGLTLRGA